MTTAGGPGVPGPAVEAATWRPLEVVHVDGWRAGFSEGFTSRANSVTTASAPADPDEAVAVVERLYGFRRLPTTFRVGPRSSPADLDDRLEARGYERVKPTVVLAARLSSGELRGPMPDAAAGLRPDPDGSPPTSARLTTTRVPTRRWVAGWLGEPLPHDARGDVPYRVLSGSPAHYLTAWGPDGPVDPVAPVGVVRVAVHGDWAGLSCLQVHPSARRRGHARSLTVAALGQAAATGASRAFLQVEESNAPAVALYESLGFVPVDSYHYRRR